MIKKHQYCFANISVMKARIFMKFHVLVNYYLEDLCLNAGARVVNARMHVSSRVRAFMTRAHTSIFLLWLGEITHMTIMGNFRGSFLGNFKDT